MLCRGRPPHVCGNPPYLQSTTEPRGDKGYLGPRGVTMETWTYATRVVMVTASTGGNPVLAASWPLLTQVG